jgi:aspartate/methionine/tyrosine aminotransferase
MELHPAAYMEWAKRHQHTRPLDLTNSGMPEPPAALVAVPHAEPARGPYGPPDLLAGVARRWGVRRDQVLLASGSSAANFVAVSVCVAAGDRVLMESPSYEPLVRIPQVFGAALDRFERREADGFRLDLDAVRRALTPRTRLIGVTNPHNPTGVRLTAAELDGLAALAAERDLHVLVDEVYLDFTGDAPQPVATTRSERLLSTSSLTKVYGLGDIRVGWACMPPGLVRRGEMLTDLINVNLPGPALRVAQQAWPHLDALQARARACGAAGRPVVERFVAAHGCRWVPGDGVPIAWIGLPRGVTGTALFEASGGAGVAVTPGANFDGQDDHIRIGWTLGGAPGLEAAFGALGPVIDRLRR